MRILYLPHNGAFNAKKGNTMANELNDLGTQVDSTVGVEASASVLIKGLADYITAHANDPAAILAFAAKLKQSSEDLAANVAANPVPQT